MVTLEVLNTHKGDTQQTLNCNTAEDREALASNIKDLLQRGFIIFVTQSESPTEEKTRVTGYDPKTNEWLVPSGKTRRTSTRMAAAGTILTAVAMIAGG